MDPPDSALPMTLLITNARIASEDSPALTEGDVLISGGKIEKIGKGLTAPDGAKVIDAKGRIVMPAMFDAHVH
ncbi:MAG: dihydroorotase, partial [Verrucomicrobiaceae bacterium]